MNKSDVKYEMLKMYRGRDEETWDTEAIFAAPCANIRTQLLAQKLTRYAN